MKTKKYITIGLAFLMLIVASINMTPEEKEYSFWVWRNTDMNLVSSNDHLVLYQGNLNKAWKFQPLGVTPSKIPQKEITLLLRLYKLGPVEDISQFYKRRVREWKEYGVYVQGLEIDYDSPSFKLNTYSKWLIDLRNRHSASLSVTSLSTYVWDNPSGLLKVADSVDYISMQLYRGYYVHPKYDEVVHWLNKNKVLHRVGVTQSSDFDKADDICLTYCEGINVFLNRRDSK